MFSIIKIYIDINRGHSSAGRASDLQSEGRRFDPVWLHFELFIKINIAI